MMYLVIVGLLVCATAWCAEEERKPSQLGCDTFEQVVLSPFFVDKSMLIKEFFHHGFILITAPRRFGKSINMNMLKTFCEVTVDGLGKGATKNVTKNYKIFSENNLKIFQERVFFHNNFGNYPTIFLDFKQLSCNNYNSFIRTFKCLLRDVYDTHSYLLHSDSLKETDRHIFEDILHPEKIRNLKDDKLYDTVKILTKLLYNHFNETKTIILIDEFDGPVQKAINYAGSDTDKIFKFIMKFISVTLKTTKFVEKALINACVSLSGLLITPANNIVSKPFLSDPKFATFYGFTENEVQNLLEKLDISDRINEIRFWYDGYKEIGTNVTIFNVYAIVSYLESCKLESYWVQTGGVRNIEWLFAQNLVLNKVEKLLEDFKEERKGIRIEYRKKITVDEVLILTQLMTTETEVKYNHVDLFFQYLTEQGYFNILVQEMNYAYIRIPNKEVEAEIEKIITSSRFYEYKFESNIYFNELAEHFETLNESNHTYITLVKCLENVYKDERKMPYNEDAFQRDMVASCTMSRLFKTVETERSVNGKRLDILLITKDKAITIELKLNLETAYTALQQMVDGKYYSMLDGKQFNIKIFLGMHLSNEGRCTISYLVNSTDITKAHNLTGTFHPH